MEFNKDYRPESPKEDFKVSQKYKCHSSRWDGKVKRLEILEVSLEMKFRLLGRGATWLMLVSLRKYERDSASVRKAAE